MDHMLYKGPIRMTFFNYYLLIHTNNLVVQVYFQCFSFLLVNSENRSETLLQYSILVLFSRDILLYSNKRKFIF